MNTEAKTYILNDMDETLQT
ncbi:hypothetical protein [Helicobacter bilis]